MLPWRHVDEHTARQRRRRTRQTQHKTVVSRSRDRPLEVELDPTFGPRRDLVAFEHDHPTAHLRRAGMEEQRRAVADRPERRRQHTHPGVDAASRLEGFRRREHVAARELVLLGSADVGRHSVARTDRLRLLVVPLQAADTNPAPRWHDFELVADAQGAVDQRAGHHGAEAAHREDAIDRQARPARIATRLRLFEQPIERRRELRQSSSSQRGHGHDASVLERGAP